MAATKAAHAKRAARAAAAGELIPPFVPATPPPEVWGICPGCDRERRVELGVLVEHRYWHAWRQQMLPCGGSGEAPAAA